MALRGERFTIDLPSDDEVIDSSARAHGSSPVPNFGLIGDVKEHSPSAESRPSRGPIGRTSVTGFPPHKKRSQVSAFRRQREEGRQERGVHPSKDFQHVKSSASHGGPEMGSGPTDGPVVADDEKERISKENNQRLAQMTAEEIESERQELMAGLSPSLIERLLKRANIDDAAEQTNSEQQQSEQEQEQDARDTSTKPVLHSQDADTTLPRTSSLRQPPVRDPDAAPQSHPVDLHPASTVHPPTDIPPPPAVHFPRPPTPPDLDPADPSFLTNLHQKYFPSLPSDPSKLAWMSPLPSENSAADRDSPYSPSQASLAPSSVRFDFRGDILPPRTARKVPVTKGLHHHGEAAEAAGYTLPELARLGRSRFPAQRCVAFQTLGRILYKLGRGRFGDEGSELAMGLWRCVDEGKVLETLQQEAAANGGHVSAKAYATEAVWLWQKGGGRRWKAS